METAMIYKSIIKVMSEINAIGKDRKNQAQGFQYRGIDDIMNELHGTLAKCGVFVVPNVLEETRTTGAYSQNHHLNGHIMQICNETGNGYSAVKDEVKRIAVENLGYPYETVNGNIHPKGESESSTDECAKLIEAAHLLAADLGIILQE